MSVPNMKKYNVLMIKLICSRSPMRFGAKHIPSSGYQIDLHCDLLLGTVLCGQNKSMFINAANTFIQNLGCLALSLHCMYVGSFPVSKGCLCFVECSQTRASVPSVNSSDSYKIWLHHLFTDNVTLLDTLVAFGWNNDAQSGMWHP